MSNSYSVEAHDLLNEATYIAEFLQSIAILKERDDALLLQGRQVSGLYCVMQDMIDRLEKADALLSGKGADDE